MEQLNVNNILGRFDKEKLLIDCLNHFEKNKTIYRKKGTKKGTL